MHIRPKDSQNVTIMEITLNTGFKLFEILICSQILIFTGGAYAPYAPCMGTPLAWLQF